MNVVVDASVAAKWLFKEADSDIAQHLLDGMVAGRFSLIAPELLLVEVGSMLWKRVIREGVSIRDVTAQYDRLKRIGLGLIGIAGLAESALQFASQYRHPIYDCVYLALAAEAGCSFVTADEKLHRALGGDFPQIRLLRNWHA